MRHECRDYQEVAVVATLKEFETHRSTLGVAATGLGKTKIAVEIAERMLPRRTLFLAHRSKLIWQARDAFMAHGIEVEIEKGELMAATTVFHRKPVVIATVQTLSSGEDNFERMKRFKPEDFGLVIYDESHHAVSPSNKKIVDYFLNGNPGLKVFGITATPDRADEEALGQMFETVSFQYNIQFGVENGWLLMPLQLLVHVGGLDYSDMGTVAGDFNGADLCRAMEVEETVQRMAMASLEAMYGIEANTLFEIPQTRWCEFLSLQRVPKRTIMFTASVKQAEMMSNVFNRVVPGISTWICGKTSEQAATDIYQKFLDGKIHCLVNCGVTTEGYDNPYVELIIGGRPTKSRSLYTQMIGRGTRPWPGIVDKHITAEARKQAIAMSQKPILTVLDFVGNAGRHKLISTADILGGEVSDVALERAKKKAEESKEPSDMRVLLEEEIRKIEEELERQRLEEEARRVKLVAKARSMQTVVSPFDVLDIHPASSLPQDNGRRLSDKQREMLVKQGVNPDLYTYAQGSQLLRDIFRRMNNQLASLKQLSLLSKYKWVLGHEHTYDPKTVSRKEASSLIDIIEQQQGWKNKR